MHSDPKYCGGNVKKDTGVETGEKFDVSLGVAQTKFKILRTYMKSEENKLQENTSGSGAVDL